MKTNKKKESELWEEYQSEMSSLEDGETTFGEWLRAKENRGQVGIIGDCSSE